MPEPPPPVPLPPLPSPPIPKDRKIFSTDQSAQTTSMSPLSQTKVITETGIDYFDKSRRKQRKDFNNNGFERFEQHTALPIIPTSPSNSWFNWTREEEIEEREEEEWRMPNNNEGRPQYRQSFSQIRNPPPPYREGNKQYYG